MMLLWNLMLLPLLIPLQTALLAGVEHSSRGWKRLFATPVPRWTVYMAKLIVSMGLFGLSMVLLDVTIVLAGMLLNAMAPALGLTFDTIPWRVLLEATARAYLASWLLIALHTWIACRWPSFVLAMGVGIAATAAGMVVWSSDPWPLLSLDDPLAHEPCGVSGGRPSRIAHHRLPRCGAHRATRLLGCDPPGRPGCVVSTDARGRATSLVNSARGMLPPRLCGARLVGPGQGRRVQGARLRGLALAAR